jgi:flavin reductase (DIM6/NTAB) family NADH-FMN oxidoreductase RutF
MSVEVLPNKIDVPLQHWDAAFAPSSALAIITTVDAQGNVNAASFGTCTRVCHDPVHIAFTCAVGKDTTNNVLANGQFVVNLVPFDKQVLDKTLLCGLPFKPGIDELERDRQAAAHRRMHHAFRMHRRLDAPVAASDHDLRQGRSGQHQ